MKTTSAINGNTRLLAESLQKEFVPEQIVKYSAIGRENIKFDLYDTCGT